MEGYGRQDDCGPNFAIVSQFHRGKSEKKHRGQKRREQNTIRLTSWRILSRPQNTEQDSLKMSFHKDKLPDTSRQTNKTKTAAFPKQKKRNKTFFKLVMLTFSGYFWTKNEGNLFFEVRCRDHEPTKTQTNAMNRCSEKRSTRKNILVMGEEQKMRVFLTGCWR